LTGVAPRRPPDDPIQDADVLLDHARRLAPLEARRTTALAAANHRSRGDLAADIGTKATALFPRQVRQSDPPVRLTSEPLGPPPPDDMGHLEDAGATGTSR
jgi:hypothetical protein